MSLPTIFVILIFLFIGGVALSFVILFATQTSKAAKGARGLQGIADQMQTQLAGMRPAWRYPIVTPTWQAGEALGVCVALLLLGLTLIGAGWFLQQRHIHEVQLLKNEGVVAVANIADQRISENDDSETYYVTFAFTAGADDQRVEVQREVSVPESFYDRVEYGSKIEVVYARSDPHIVRIRALYTPGKIKYWWLIFLGGAGGLCLLFAWIVLGIYRNANRLDEEGMSTTTVLLDCFEHSDSDNTAYYLVYDLPGVGPIRHIVEKRVYNRLTIGDTFSLVYLPDNPKIFRPLWN